jgi:hypothetical protein
VTEREYKIGGVVQSVFTNRLKYGAGDLHLRLYHLDTLQQEHFAKEHLEEIQSGVFERKILHEFDECYTDIIKQTIDEMDGIYYNTFHQDPHTYWTAVKKFLIEQCSDEEAIEARFKVYLKRLNYGTFSETRCIHIDYRVIIENLVEEYRKKAFFSMPSTPRERQETLIPDVAVFLGRKDSEASHYHEHFKIIDDVIKRDSGGYATVDSLDGLMALNEEAKHALVERWIYKVPIFLTEVSTRHPTGFCLWGMRKARNLDVIAICHERAWDDAWVQLLEWPVVIYENDEDLRGKLSLAFHDVFERHEFSGHPDVIL